MPFHGTLAGGPLNDRTYSLICNPCQNSNREGDEQVPDLVRERHDTWIARIDDIISNGCPLKTQWREIESLRRAKGEASVAPPLAKLRRRMLDWLYFVVRSWTHTIRAGCVSLISKRGDKGRKADPPLAFPPLEVILRREVRANPGDRGSKTHMSIRSSNSVSSAPAIRGVGVAEAEDVGDVLPGKGGRTTNYHSGRGERRQTSHCREQCLRKEHRQRRERRDRRERREGEASLLQKDCSGGIRPGCG